MERLRQLNIFQKTVLIVMVIMTVSFAAAYHRAVSREGVRYRGALLVRQEQNWITTYSGRIGGDGACFRVSGSTVEFIWGDRTYGPYVIREDPAAETADADWGELSRGIEITCADDILFRGSAVITSDVCFLYAEADPASGTAEAPWAFPVTVTSGGERTAPDMETIVRLVYDPVLTHRGEWGAWLAGALICCLSSLSVIFSEELFRLRLSFLIRDAQGAEPSDIQIAGRYFSWCVMPLIALTVFVLGLR
ncbi:MAG: hypothetical protein J5822_04770 [Eubacteriaceae bacterium]|nr:hypothetical protein [Eubacteriaceae bacterium]